jgi:Cu+-exporting ATPase
MRVDQTLTLSIEKLSCASCVGRAERAILAQEGVLSAHVNLATEQAEIRFSSDAELSKDVAQSIRDTVTAAGYPATVLMVSEGDGGAQSVAIKRTQNRARKERKSAETGTALRRFWIAAVLALPVFLMEMGGHAVPAVHHFIMQTIGHQASWLIQWGLTTAVLLGPGFVFFRLGLPALLKGAPEMNSLVALGAGAAYLYSCAVTFAPDVVPREAQAVYFESAAVIVVLILLGRYFEARAKGKAGAAIETLLELQEPHALVLQSDGTQTQIVQTDIDAVQLGDVILVRPGARIAVDGVVVAGESYVDEAMLTGEPEPVHKSKDALVTGGTVNGSGSLHVRTERLGYDSTLAHIVRSVEAAQNAKLPVQDLVDQITRWFVPAILCIAVLTVTAWLFFMGEHKTHALVAGVSVLIVACPCAMGLATPTSIMVGSGRAAELGVLFRKGQALQQLGQVKLIAFDKTGTLTQGRPEVTQIFTVGTHQEADVLADVAAVQQHSEHPVAYALRRAGEAYVQEENVVQGFEAIAGLGVRGQVGERDILIGNAKLMEREAIDMSRFSQAEGEGQSPVFVAINGKAAATLFVQDQLRSTARQAVRALRERGIELAMITGDTEQTAKSIAAQLGITHVYAQVLPDEKVAALKDLQRLIQAPVAFVGDGLNDAPVLAQADVGIAIGSGTQVAIESADVVLMQEDLLSVVTALEVSKRTMKNIQQNLFWAFAYNVALVPVAAGALFASHGVLLSPALAAGAMAASSIIVVCNALRLRTLCAE